AESHRLPEDRDDELGQVMQALNEMFRRTAGSILATEEARRALALANDRLESRVNQRTQALVEANAQLRHEIAERRRIEEQLRHDAFHDRLTQLPNRQLFVDRVEHALRRTRRNKDRHFAVVLLNLD